MRKLPKFRSSRTFVYLAPKYSFLLPLCPSPRSAGVQALTISPQIKPGIEFANLLLGFQQADKTRVGSCSYLHNRRLICITSSSLKPSIQLSPTPRALHTPALPPCLLETAMKALRTWYPPVCTSETESSRNCSIPRGY